MNYMFYVLFSIFNVFFFIYRVINFRLFSIYKISTILLFSIPYVTTLILSIVIGFNLIGFKLSFLPDLFLTIFISLVNETLFRVLRKYLKN